MSDLCLMYIAGKSNDLEMKEHVRNLLIPYNVRIRYLQKIGEIWAFHLENEITRMARFCLQKRLTRAVLELESVAQIILQYSR